MCFSVLLKENRDLCVCVCCSSIVSSRRTLINVFVDSIASLNDSSHSCVFVLVLKTYFLTCIPQGIHTFVYIVSGAPRGGR